MQRRITHKVHYTTEMPQQRRGRCIFFIVFICRFSRSQAANKWKAGGLDSQNSMREVM